MSKFGSKTRPNSEVGMYPNNSIFVGIKMKLIEQYVGIGF